MKNIVIKVHDNSKTIAMHRLDIDDKKPTVIHAKPHLNYEFIDAETGVSPNHIVTKRGGNDLGVLLNNEVKNAGIVIIKDFYKYPDNALIGKAEDREYYHFIPDTGEVADYVSQLAPNKSSGQALGANGFAQPWWIDGSHTKSHKGFKSFFKSIFSDDSTAIDTSPQSIEYGNTNINPVKITKSTGESSWLEDFEVSPWLIGAGVGLGALAFLSNKGDNEDKDSDSSKDKTDYTLKGSDKGELLEGTNENDSINALAGNDKLDGKAGNDTLLGGDGIDTLIGGKGSDTLTGGKDSDIFKYKLSDFTDKDFDTITDFTPKEDKIQLPKELFKSDKVAENLADYIKYDEETGELSYDVDGKGGADAVIFATLSNHPELMIDSDTFQII